MEYQALKKYFLSDSLGLCIVGLVASVLSGLWLFLKFKLAVVFVKVYLIEVILLLAGPILLFSTIKSTIRAAALLSKLKRTDTLGDVYRSFTNADNVSFNKNEIIVSDNYLFLKDEVAVIPYPQLTQVYVKNLKNDKNEITGVQLYCSTAKKKKIRIFPNIKETYELMQFVECVRQKNPGIRFQL